MINKNLSCLNCIPIMTDTQYFRRFFFTCLTFAVLLPYGLRAQHGDGQGSITGLVTDQVNGQFIEYANVVLFRMRDSSMVNGGITNTSGIFKLEKVPFGRYYAVVTFLGYSNKRIPEIMVNPKNPNVDLGKIELSSVSSRLGEVTITAEKPAMEFTLDRKVINVEKNIATMGGSAVDVLQNVPSVTVDENGAVSLRGDANVTLLIDGRPSGLTGTKLEQIPASSIETIELITNPSARYNPEGMSGIINIKLKKKKEGGFNGLVSMNAGTGEKYNGSVNLNYNTGKLNFFGSVDYRDDRRKGWGDNLRRTYYTDSVSILSQHSDNKRKRKSTGVKLGVDMAFNEKNSLLVSWMKNTGPSEGVGYTESLITNGNGTPMMQYNYESNQTDDDDGSDYILNYRKTFAQKGRELTLDVVYNTDKEDEKEYYRQRYTINVTDSLFPPSSPYPQRALTITDRDNANIQLNYVHPFGEKIKLEGGFQGIFRSTDDDYRFFELIEGVYEEDFLQSNRFLYKERINALYAIFGFKSEQYTLQAGLRAENAHTTSEQKTLDQTFDKTYNSLYPSIHLTRKLPLRQEVQVSYSRRVNRPDMRSLNPFVDRRDPLSLHYGNPHLNPEYISIYELGYSKYFKKSTLNTSLFYRDIRDVIRRYVYVDTTNNQEVFNMTFLNLSSGISYGLEVVLDHQFYKWWRISANASYFKTEIKGEAEDNSLTNENYSWTSRINNTFVLPGKLTVQVNAFYRGPMVNPQGTMKEMFGSDLAVRKDFFNDKLNLSFRLSDIFNTMSFRMDTYGTNFDGEYDRRRESRVAYIGVQVKIGQNGNRQKRGKRTDDTNSRENMDDFDF